METKRLAYLVSEYPAISHTFILREISSLSKEGIEVIPFSIRHPLALANMGNQEQEEAKRTLYIKPRLITSAPMAHLKLLCRHPFRYLRMLGRTLSLASRHINRFFHYLAYFAEAGIILDRLKTQKIDHLHVHFANPAATVALIAKSYGQISYSLSVHGPDIFSNVDQNLLREKIEGSLFVRCISYFCKTQLAQLVPHKEWKKLHIVRCGVDHKVWSRPDSLPQNTSPHIVCVGRLTPAKGQHILLEACQRLKQKEIPFQLTFIGGGQDLSSLEKLSQRLDLSSQVTFTGPLTQSEVKEKCQQSDIFVLPSFAEGVPCVLMEAMALKIPCIASRITGIPELIENQLSGLLFTPGNVDELTTQMEELIKNPSRRQEIGERGHQSVKQSYDLHNNCQALAHLFKKQLQTIC